MQPKLSLYKFTETILHNVLQNAYIEEEVIQSS